MRVRLSNKLHKKVKRIAAERGESMSELARRQARSLPLQPETAKRDLWIDTSIRFSPDEIARLDQMAVKLGIPRNSAIRVMLEAAVAGGTDADPNDA